jgi:hypothetical protein
MVESCWSLGGPLESVPWQCLDLMFHLRVPALLSVKGFSGLVHGMLLQTRIEEIFAHDEVQVQDYIKGIVTAGICCYKYEVAEEARKVFQNEVFAPLVEDPELQKHLALNPGQHVQSQ